MRDKSLKQWAEDAWATFTEHGGTIEMFLSGQYQSRVQAYYAGEVWAFNKVLDELGQGQVLAPGYPMDFHMIDKDYVSA